MLLNFILTVFLWESQTHNKFIFFEKQTNNKQGNAMPSPDTCFFLKVEGGICTTKHFDVFQMFRGAKKAKKRWMQWGP